MNPSKKNILYILVDQQRLDMLGCYGNRLVKTPNIDALASEGVRFSNAYTPSAICGPARTSLFTGLIPTQHGVTQNAETGSMLYRKADPQPGIETLGDYLKEYQKFYLGKWHIAETKLPSSYGFSGHDFPGYGFPASGVYKNLVFNQGPGEEGNRYREWLEERGCSEISVSGSFFGTNPHLQIQELYGDLDCDAEASIPAFLSDEAVTCLKGRDTEKPFFMWLNFWGPHTPCLLPKEYADLYREEDILEDPGFAETFQGKPVHHEHVSYMWGVHDLEWKQWARIIRYYYGYISMIDHYVGRLMEKLKELDLYESTHIVFTADHGDAMGSHRLIEKGEFMYDETYRIPLIVRSPDADSPGRTCDDFVYLHDLFHTALDMAGEQQDNPRSDAQSLLPHIADSGYHNRRDCVYGQFTGHFTDFVQRMLRTNRYKLVFNSATIGELYDLEKDPKELKNLIADPDYREIKREMISRLLAEMRQREDPAVGWLSRIQDHY